MTRTALLVAVQTDPAFGEVEANIAVAGRLIETHAPRADLVVLPELFATGYSFRDRAEALTLAEPYPGGPTLERVRAWSRDVGGMVVGGYVERDGDRLYNAAVVAAGGKALGSYRKVHLFGFEREIFDPGDRPFEVFEHAGLRVGVMICFDWMYPEAARTLALSGADVIAHPSNLVLPGWCQRAMCVRALENQVYTVTANRHGAEDRPPRPRLRFTGASRIVDTRGDVLADAAALGDEVLTAGVDATAARNKTVPSGNDVFAERRPLFYAGWSEQGS